MDLNFPKWVIVITLLKDNDIVSKVSKDANITYSHACTILKEFVNENLIDVNVRGRTRVITLTTKGRRLKYALLKAKF